MKARSFALITGLVLVVGACSGGAASPAASTAASSAPSAAASTGTGEQPYIPVISKGFQHQFWQAVKLGSDKAAAEFNVKITFEGPENETQVDKQIEMLQAALDK